jgi:two-component system, NarL family, sensor histidine kinase UhpB
MELLPDLAALRRQRTRATAHPCNIQPKLGALREIRDAGYSLASSHRERKRSVRHLRSNVSTSLRLRLITSITLMFVMSMLPGSLLIYWHAVHQVDVELRAAAAVGMHTIHNAVDDPEEAVAPLRHLQLLIADFDGDRHLRASLQDATGRVLYQSTPLQPADPAPEWFYRLLARPPAGITANLPPPFDRIGRILLQPDAHNEISEAWDDAVLTLMILALFSGMNAALVYWITGRALRPLETVSAAFTRLGAGSYRLHIPEHGPREFAQVSRGLNQLALQLADAETRRLALERQLSAVQEEERAELARDLHDEIGPLLFAVGVDLSVIQHDPAVRNTAVATRVEAVRQSISRIYDDIKKILGRLQTATPAELGLAQAIDNLASFWRMRYPAVEFQCDVPDEGFGSALDDAIYHVIMEAMSNALRHGTPTCLRITVNVAEGQVVASVRDNGGGFSTSARTARGFGLTSMEQRVNALGGSLQVTVSREEPGVIVTASMPLAESEGAQSGARVLGAVSG